MNSIRSSRLAVAISVASLVCLSLPAAAAEVYKCTNAAGKVEFQDRPCDGKATGQRLDVQPNSAGHMSLEEVRAKAAALKGKHQARQDAENKAAAADYAAREKAWQQDRAHQDAIDMQQAVRDSGASAGQAQYNNGYYAGTQQPQKLKVEIAVQPAPSAPPAVPAKSTAK